MKRQDIQARIIAPGAAKRDLRQRLLSQAVSVVAPALPDTPSVQHWSAFTLAKSLAKSGRYAEAIGHAEKAVHLNPTSQSAKILRDQVLDALKSSEPHLVAMELSIGLSPDDADTYLTLGVAYSARNRFEDAERAFNRALELGRPLESHTELAVLYCDQARYDDAARHAEAALAIAPSPSGLCGSMANEVMARIALARGQTQAYEKYLRRAFAEQNMFHITPMETPFNLVILVSQSASNIPLNSLLPVEQFGRVLWYMEYAGLEQIDHLPKDAVYFNAIGEPDNAKAALDLIAEISPQLAGKILNPPDKVMATRRDHLAETLKGIDNLWTPATVRCPAISLTPEFLGSLFANAGPTEFLIRPIGSHVGLGLQRIPKPSDLNQYDFGDAHTLYVSRFWEGRSKEGLYRAYRVICIDRQIYPYHLAIASDWMVHRHTTEMDSHPDLVMEELAFLDNPAAAIGQKAYDALCQAAKRLDLDFVGIDFGITEAGEVVVFEANATMLVRPEAEDGLFADKSRHIGRIIKAFQDHMHAAASG
ncbi:MAG: hypothetical protein CGW95_00360 [Phenylobacterium zucineum]|nr:MAG: hypothetical protein CGW95_00360 [Phenylobacterium zucineum]